MNRILKSIFLVLAGFVLAVSSAEAKAVRDGHVEAELVSEVKTAKPGYPFWVAVHLKMDEGWHVYWKNPGDSGLAVEVKWEVPEGMRVGTLQWPYPKKIELPPLTSYGYEGEVYLLNQMVFPPIFEAGGKEQIKAEVRWLVCEILCVPGKAQLSFNLPIKDAAVVNAPVKAVFDEVRAKIPQTRESWGVRVSDTSDFVILDVTPPKLKQKQISQLQFFPESSELIDHSAVQELKEKGSGYRLSIPRSSLTSGPVKKLKGILLAGEADGSRLPVDVNYSESGEAGSMPESGSIPAVTALFFAFLGGIILNLMPCVFPIISLKILGFVNQSSGKRSSLLTHAFFYTLGIVVSFWVLAGIFLGLRLGGQSIGWGFQFQSPLFIIVMANLFFIFGLNFFGAFEIGMFGLSLGALNKKTAGYTQSFLTGLLATVVATPCTAPFMGTALSFALTQPTLLALTVFTFLGLGMASPYLVLCGNPKLLKFLPKPGAWMITLKKFLGTLLFLTCVWLLWVLSLQLGSRAAGFVTLGFFMVTFSFWILTNLSAIAKGTAVRNLVRFFFCLWLSGGFLFSLAAAKTPKAGAVVESKTQSGIQWVSFNDKELEKLLKQNRSVFVDFTAAWCLTCKVNEQVALSDSKVVNIFLEKNIVAMKADLTVPDEMIVKALNNLGKSSIPVYALYPAGSKGEPVLLPELLTPGIVLNELNKL